MKYTINPLSPKQFAYDSPTYLEGITEEDIVGLDYGHLPILDDTIYVAKGKWEVIDEEYGHDIMYEWFLMMKKPMAVNTSKVPGSGRFSECYIIPITWDGWHWSRQHINMLANFQPGYRHVWYSDYDEKNEVIIREWAILKEEPLPFLNWLTENPLGVKR